MIYFTFKTIIFYTLSYSWKLKEPILMINLWIFNSKKLLLLKNHHLLLLFIMIKLSKNNQLLFKVYIDNVPHFDKKLIESNLNKFSIQNINCYLKTIWKNLLKWFKTLYLKKSELYLKFNKVKSQEIKFSKLSNV